MTQETTTHSNVFKTKFSTGGFFVVILLGLAILSLAERVLYDTGRLLVVPPLDYFNNIYVIGIHTVVVVLFLALAFGINISLGERKQKYAIALIPYFVVSIILALQLILQIAVYFSIHHTTFEFYLAMIAIIMTATYGMYIAQKKFMETKSVSSGTGPNPTIVIVLSILFLIIFARIYFFEQARYYEYNYYHQIYPGDIPSY